VAIPTIAEALGIPNRYVAFCPTPLHSPAHAPPYVPWTSQRPWFNEMTWRVLRSVVNLFSRKTLNRLRAERDLDPIRDVFLHAISRQSILAADPVLAPAPPDLAGETIQTGAWLLQQDDALDPRIEEFLAEGEPPIFIGFGSMSDRRAARTRAMLLEAIAGGGCRALLAGSTAIERLAPGVLGIGAAPHEKLFPRVRVVVHHGGAGTTTVAASAGAAQVVVPHGFDQFYWADRVRSLGVGTTVRRSRLTAPRLTAALRLALSEPMHLRARELSREIAGDGVVRAVQFIERECVR
jgi:vancomycin aglycone glucosyltransferase